MLRIRRGLTQAALAQKANVSREYLSRLESGGQNPTLSVIDRIARALKVSVAELLT